MNFVLLAASAAASLPQALLAADAIDPVGFVLGLVLGLVCNVTDFCV
jgi:hypothetical protein